MPTYEYLCRDCGHGFDIVQSFKDESLTICPACGGVLRKVFAAPAISFKGSGFYATDSRKGSKSSESKHDGAKQESAKSDSKNDSSKGEGSKDTSSKETSSKDGSSSSSSSSESGSSKPKETSSDGGSSKPKETKRT
jgi:putative FmdB family regulatory protein